MKKFYLPIAAIALMAAGCTNEDEMAGMSGGDLTGTAMKVTTNVEVPQTRGTMTTDNLIEFYMRVTDADGTTDDYDYLVLMQKNGSEWSPSDGTELWWGDFNAQVSAVYQEDVDWSDRGVYDTYGKAVSIQTDQSTEENVQSSDLLYMKPVTVSPTDYTSAQNPDGSIKVTLTHRFSLLNINISNLAGDSNPIESVTVGGTVTDATYIPYDAFGDDLMLGSERDDITAHAEGYSGGTASYECIILPQDISAGPLTITANIGGTEYVYTYDGNISTAANTRYTFNLTVRSDMLVGDEVTITDWEDSGEEISGSMDIAGYTYDETTNTYTVYTAEGLLAWANAAAEYDTPNCTLAADIDMKDLTDSYTWPSIMYEGTFDGAGHTISNFTINPNEDNVGFIGVLLSGGTIKDLAMTEASVKSASANPYDSGYNTGGIVGSMYEGSISGCSFSGTVGDMEYNSGGIVGSIFGGSVSDCNVSAAITSSYEAGGIAGFISDATVSGCTFSGTVGGSAVYYSGGIAGILVTGNITACYSAGTVNSSQDAGGIVGQIGFTSEVTACYSTATVIGIQAGGIAGTCSDYGEISNCFWSNEGVSAGVGSGTDPTTKVDGETATWSYAMGAMNEALGGDYQYFENTDEETKVTFPLLVLNTSD